MEISIVVSPVLYNFAPITENRRLKKGLSLPVVVSIRREVFYSCLDCRSRHNEVSISRRNTTRTADNRRAANQLMEFLLQHGADPNLQDANGDTCVSTATAVGASDALDILLAHKANVNLKNNKGETLLALARAHHSDLIAQKLVQAGAKE